MQQQQPTAATEAIQQRESNTKFSQEQYIGFFIHAALSEDTTTMKNLIAQGVDVNARDSERNWTPLIYVCGAGKQKIATWLLANGADPNVKDNIGYTIIHAAAQSGDIDTLTWALKISDLSVDSKLNDGRTPLDIAKQVGRYQLYSFLESEMKHIEQVIPPSFSTAFQLPPPPKRPSSQELLTLGEEKLQQQQPTAATAATGAIQLFHAAAESGDINTIEFALKDSGLSIDVKDNAGRTPLDVAKELGHTHLHHFLGGEDESRIEHTNNITKIQTEINPLLQSISGDPEAKVEHDLDNKSSTEIQQIIDNTEISQQQLHDPQLLNQLLIDAASTGNIVEIRKLIFQKANINCRDIDDKTPLIHACLMGHKDAALLLMENGADIGTKDKYGNNILHAAAKSGDMSVLVLALKNSGLHPSVRNKMMMNPIDIAKKEGHIHLYNLLLEEMKHMRPPPPPLLSTRPASTILPPPPKRPSTQELITLAEEKLQQQQPAAAAEAIQLFNEAADGGNTTAMVKLGDIYNEGKFVERSEEKAKECYKEAQSLYDPEAAEKHTLISDKQHSLEMQKLQAEVHQPATAQIDPDLLKELADNLESQKLVLDIRCEVPRSLPLSDPQTPSKLQKIIVDLQEYKRKAESNQIAGSMLTEMIEKFEKWRKTLEDILKLPKEETPSSKSNVDIADITTGALSKGNNKNRTLKFDTIKRMKKGNVDVEAYNNVINIVDQSIAVNESAQKEEVKTRTVQRGAKYRPDPIKLHYFDKFSHRITSVYHTANSLNDEIELKGDPVYNQVAAEMEEQANFIEATMSDVTNSAYKGNLEAKTIRAAALDKRKEGIEKQKRELEILLDQFGPDQQAQVANVASDAAEILISAKSEKILMMINKVKEGHEVQAFGPLLKEYKEYKPLTKKVDPVVQFITVYDSDLVINKLKTVEDLLDRFDDSLEAKTKIFVELVLDHDKELEKAIQQAEVEERAKAFEELKIKEGQKDSSHKRRIVLSTNIKDLHSTLGEIILPVDNERYLLSTKLKQEKNNKAGTYSGPAGL